MHLFLTVAELKNIESGSYNNEEPFLQKIFQEIRHPDWLYIAGFLHDIGKGLTKSHAVQGAEMVNEICQRIGLSDKARSEIKFLVLNHLLLFDTSTRRDLNDEGLIVNLAQRIGDVQRLKMLYLLTVADAIATGPKAWNQWKSTLWRELFFKILHVLEKGEYTPGTRKKIEQKIAKARKELASRYSPLEIEKFFATMPPAYALNCSYQEMLRHFDLLANFKSEKVLVSKGRKIGSGLYEFLVAAIDQPGLFCKVSGVLALHGVNILSAQVFTRKDGIALEIFRVSSYFDEKIEQAKWQEIETTIKQVLKGKIALDYHLTEKAKSYSKVLPVSTGQARVEVDNESSDFYTIIEVFANDRIGLLYKITKAMYDLSLNIYLAKVATNVDQVVDVFYVLDVEGQKITDQQQVKEIKKAILLGLSA
jgi:[protein-PII] uridylyltransferase